MKELEDTNCEIRRIVELQNSIWDRLNAASDDEQSPGNGPNDAFEPTKPLGGFLDGTHHAWLSCGTRLLVLNVRTGESISSWNFRYKISSVSPFPIQAGQLPLLLVGLDNDAHRIKDSVGMICVFECTTSRILRVIRVPCGVEQICVINGGSEWEELCDQKTATIFGSNSGIACVALRNFDYLIIDLQRSSWDSVSSYLVTDELSPYEIEFPNSKTSSSSRRSCNKEKHAAYSLINNRIEKYIGFKRETFESMSLPEEKLTTTIINSKKIGCLIAGCLGRVMMWQSDGSIGWISPQFDDNMSVSHLALIEPADDPRSFYYLWIACEDDSGIAAPVLRMYAMLFEKKYIKEETSFTMESDPSLKFEIELDEGDTISCMLPIERENTLDQSDSGSRRGEESLLLIGANNRMLLFDLNQWYKEQMPLTVSECPNPNSILASYRTGSEIPNSVRDVIINTAYVPSSIKEFINSGPNTMEELFFPNCLSFEWIELTANRLTFWLTRGVQADLLRKIVITGPVTLIQPAETFHRCIAAGLVPFNTECSFNSDHNAQREMLLSLCLEQRWANFLVKCAKEWSDGSASYLFPAFLRWGVQRGTSIKIYADQLSIPLFDQSGNNIGESETKILRFCCQQLECLSNVVSNLNVDSAGFLMQQRALKRVATYFQVLLWFQDVGLLPETQEVDERHLKIALSLRIPYPYQRLMMLYKEKREKHRAKRNSTEDDNLFIDNLIIRECSLLRPQWEREGVDVESVGQYPPPSLQSLLRSYLADCHQEESNELVNKHQITIYLLMDLAMLLQGSCPSIDQLIKYPAAFKLSPSIIKLTQAFWLLDHEDYQGFLDMMTGQLVSESDIKDWHHQLIIKTLVHDNQHKLALMYLRVRKPPLMTIEEQGTVISLSVEYGLVQSAFHCRPSSHYSQLLMRFFRACKSYGKLPEILHLALDKEEEEAFVRFLEEDKCDETKLLYYLQRSRHTEASSVSSSSRFAPHLEQPVSLNMFKAYNCTLPDITRRFTTNLMKKNSDMDLDIRYPRPMSHARSYNRAQEIHETVVKKAKETFNRGERTQVPFISAPCMSLRNYPPSSDVNCVLYMERKKTPVKRTIYQMQGNDETVESNDKKRMKLSEDQSVGRKSEKNKSLRNKSSGDKSELGIDALFSTPLVKRKTLFTNSVNTPLETPHSILKIRQMIRESGSPTLNISLNLENASDPVNDKKPRQIRFSMSQIQDDSVQSESTDKESSKSLRDVNDSKEVIDEEASEVSEDHFFSPNISARSDESTILSDCSSSYARNISGPRPRPGLKRRSVILSSNDSSRRTWSKTASTSSAETPSSLSLSSKETGNSPANSIDFNIGKSPRARNPLLSSIYSSSILSDSSYDENSKKLDDTGKGLEWEIENSFSEKNNSNSEKVIRVSDSISHSRLMKIVVEEIDDEKEEEVNASKREETDEEELREETKESELSNNKIIKDIDRTMEIETENCSTNEEEEEEEKMHNEKLVSEKLSEANGAAMVHLEEELDESSKVSGIHEDTNRNILHEGTMLSTQDHHSLSENEKELEGDSSDDLELLSLKDDEAEEVFESLSNSISSDVAHSLSTTEKSILKKQDFMEKSGFSKLVEDDFDITDDESFEKMDESLSEKGDKTIQDDQKDVDSNITDDESDKINTKEPENIIRDSKENLVSISNDISKSDSDSLSNCNNASITVNRSEEALLNPDNCIEEVSKRKVSLRRTPDRELRMRRASSIAKETKSKSITESIAENSSDIQVVSSKDKEDNVRKSNISREKTPIRETRSQKTSSTTKVTVASQENIIEKSLVDVPETQRISPESKKVNVKKRSASREKTPVRETRAQKTSSTTKVTVASQENIVEKSLVDVPDTQRISPESKKDNVKKRSASREKTPVRETRAQKTGSARKDLLSNSKHIIEESSADVPETRQVSCEAKEDEVRKTRSSREKTPVRETRTQKTLSLKKDSLASQESLTFDEGPSTPRRSRRASSVSKIVDTTEELNPQVEMKDMEKKGVRCKTPIRETKTRSLSKSEESQIEEIETDKMRTRRGSSLAKEILASTIESGNKRGGRKISSESEGSVELTPKRGRPKKIQETCTSQETEKEPEEASTTIRRNTRRAVSLQKELTIIEEVAPKKQKTVIEEPIEVDTSETIKRSTRSKRGNSVAMEISLPRLTRGASLSKEIVEQPAETSTRQTRRRGNSVPKEVMLAPSKTKRSANISEEVINEEPTDENEESRTNVIRTLRNKILTEEIKVPVTRKRTRCLSVQSIPEEVEEILSIPDKSKSTKNNEKRETLPRMRRAASVDLPVEPKRYTRSNRLKQSILEDAILEESTEAEETKINSKVVTKQPPRRKRAASETVALDEKEESLVKSTAEKPRRVRKISQKSDDAKAEFSFSPPEKTSAPNDKKGISQIPNYVFSPPHTRSKQTSQPRRCVSFIPTLTEEEKQEAALLKAVEAENKSNEKQDNKEPSRNPILRFVPTSFAPRTTFSLNKPKKQ